MYRCDPNGEVIVYVSKVVQHSADSIVRKQSMPKPRMPRPRGEQGAAPVTEPVKGSQVDVLSVYYCVEPIKDEKKDKFVGFARIFSGTIRRGQEVHVLGPKYSPLEPTKHHSVMTVDELYVLMGKELELIDQVPAGTKITEISLKFPRECFWNWGN
jgi:ribosome assembly protein 1